MAQKDVGNKIPIYKLKTTDEVMKYYDEWGHNDKYNKDMVDWNYTGPKETSDIFVKYQKNKDIKIYDAGCGTGLVGVELKKYGFYNFYGADLSQKLLDLVPKELYKKFKEIKLVLTDVDGVLTDGGMYYTTEGDIMKKFHARDGMGVTLADIQ